jgi:hypothetical protein
MTRRSHSHYVNVEPQTPDQPQQASATVVDPLADNIQSEKLNERQREKFVSGPDARPDEILPQIDLVPAARRLYQTFRKIDHKKYYSDEEFNAVCVLCAGDKRRILQRMLLGIYQRAFTHNDADEVHRSRLLLDLHESEVLEENLESI